MSSNTEFEDNSHPDIESEDNNRPRHPGGRPPNPVWEHFERKPISSSGHFSATCNYCNTFMSRGRPNELQVHLSKDCRKCPSDVQLKYLTMIVNE